MIDAWFAAAIALFAPLARGGENSVALAELEVEGPLGGIVLELGALGETRLSGTLLAGERKRLVAPIAVRGPVDGLVPDVRSQPLLDILGEKSGRARFVRWVEGDETGYDRLPPALRARPRPPLERPLHEPNLALVLILGAVFVAGASVRRRTLAAISIAVAGVGAVVWLGPRSDPEGSAHLALIEGAVESPLWLEVEGAVDRLDIDDLEKLGRIEVVPETARIVWQVPLQSGQAARIEAADARIYRVRVFEPGDRRPTRAENRLERTFAETWLRSEGTWTSHGVWGRQEPWPSTPTGSGAPPGWLASGLPQGPSVLLGRLDGVPAAWVRVTGF